MLSTRHRWRGVRAVTALALGVATAGAVTMLSAAVGVAGAAPASAGGIGPCPNSNTLSSYKAADNVAASYASQGNKTTYTFSSLVDQSPSAGVPGLVRYCVYPSSPPDSVGAVAEGANGAMWTSAKGSDNFAFMRPGGNKTNIPLDGTTTDMGTATWATDAPASQTILLHIADSTTCANLYGGTSPTCFVKPAAGPICNLGATTPAYNALPFGVVDCPKPSLGFEAQSVNEFGDEVTLSTGTPRGLDSLAVVFSSYACSVSGHWNTGDCVSLPGATFQQEVTAKIYAASDLTMPIATATQTFTIPYRPTAAADCPASTDYVAGSGWHNPANGNQCQVSISKVLTFTDWTFTGGVPVPLPEDVVWTVAFNTSHAGYSPLGDCPTGSNPGCAYDSLNVSVKSFPGAPYAGTDVSEDVAYISTSLAPALTAEAGWTTYRPLGQVNTK